MKQLEPSKVMQSLKENNYLARYEKAVATEQLSSYFLHPSGIHGMAHAKRVLLLSLALALYNQLAGDDLQILVRASLYHDTGRTHDGTCFEHGKLSWQKMLSLGLAEEKEDDDVILRYVIENHCLDDEVALNSISDYQIQNRTRAVDLLKIFKDSDGLDRVRIGDLDPRYLRTPAAPKLVDFAYYLHRTIK